MNRLGGRGTTRALAVVLGATNLALVARPDDVSAAVAPGRERPPSWLVRVLGSRVALQQLLVLARPTRGLVLLGAAVDALHATSMVAATQIWPQHRRVAGASAAVAAASAVLELTTAPPGTHR
ncbi:hypothetical protein [Modestobacter altitudinis]|uniref:hypothetical protein n=1 Tax=Modestobacter altitudinis TaxID=2213158 RepID=UPI00110D0B87|nr:hypothetical protein [Modestobacter altitudinis]